MDRFPSLGHFASYARCVDSQRISNGKNDNKYLAWAFVEAANFAMRFSAEAKCFYERKKARTNNVLPRKRWRTYRRAPASTT